ncbi:MAG: hypothetical protein EOM20_12795 [Spartobacteria bacterium]|nr:hypothetical protein [Spartobacteria bacterium]
MKNCHIPILFLLAMLLSGCLTGKGGGTAKSAPSDRMEAYLSQAQDARRHWLSIYQSGDGPVYVGSHRLHSGQKARVDFISARKSDLPVIEIRPNENVYYSALIDTSSRFNWIALDGALELRMFPLGPPIPEQTPSHVNDPTTGYLSLATKFRIEQLHIENALFYTLASQYSLGPLARNSRHPIPRMVLGCDMLNAMRFFQLNYPGRRAAFSSTLPYKTSDDHLIASMPLKSKYGAMAVEGAVDGQADVFILDSAGDYELAMDVDAPATANQVSLGDLVFRQVAVTPIEQCGVGHADVPHIGKRLLSRFVVTFDPQKKVVYFEKP